MDTFEWENGTIVERPYVEIDGTKYYVEDGTTSGGTPVSANNLNEMQNILNGNIEDIDNKHDYISSEERVVGKWKENNVEYDIYEKSFTINIGTNVDYNVDIGVNNISRAWFNMADSFWITSYISETLGHYSSSTDWSRFYIANNKIYASFGSAYSTIQKTAYVAVRYLKSS